MVCTLSNQPCDWDTIKPLFISKTRGEMYATVGECGEIEFAPNILFTTLHELLLRIHGITCQKPIRIWKDTFQK